MILPLQISAGSRTGRYTDRLDRHLVKLPDDRSRVLFLMGQLEDWFSARDGFCKLMASKHYDHPAGGADIHDYDATIGEISSRIGKYKERVAARKPATGSSGLASAPVNSEAR